MAFGISTPDIDEYIKRINQIQRVIIPTSATTLTPRAGTANYPYWLTLARNISIASQTASASQLTIVVDMLLVRGGANSGYDGQREREILNDMALVVSYFKRHRQLLTNAYSAIQAYFVPDSATITQASRFEGSLQGDAVVIGSLYTLQFKHNLVKTDNALDTP